jgi:hypothetical protein
VVTVSDDCAAAQGDRRRDEGAGDVVKLNFNPGTAAKYDIMPIPTLDVCSRTASLPGSDRWLPKQKLEQWVTALV